MAEAALQHAPDLALDDSDLTKWDTPKPRKWRVAQIPEMMTAVVLDSYSGPDALRVERRPVPKPGKNEVLVRVAAAPINPSDLNFMAGGHSAGQSSLPIVPGIEGAGTVVAAGEGVMARYLRGKRVACVRAPERDGVWAEYMVTKAGLAYPLDASVGLEEGSMSVINPLTAMAFIKTAQAGGHKSIVNTAAAGTLGQMLNRLGRSEGIEVINVVRREAQVGLLKEQGATIVLNSSEADFVEQLRDASHRFQAGLAFDAVSGAMTRGLLEGMPDDSQIIVYGQLSQEPIQVEAVRLYGDYKTVSGFYLATWFSKRNMLQNMMLWRKAQKRLSTELKTHIRAQVPLKDAQKAVKEYQGHMTGGKVLLRPDL
ncbi:MAG: zinc-binding dehydrogenase [Chloroflexota bacterium]